MPPSALSGPASRSSPRRFLVDENVARQVTQFLRDRGHDVLDVKEEGWFGRSDAELFTLAEREGRVTITYDVDFAGLRRLSQSHPGIMFVRLRNLRPERIITTLDQFLRQYGDRDLADTLAVIQERRVRFRGTR